MTPRSSPGLSSVFLAPKPQASPFGCHPKPVPRRIHQGVGSGEGEAGEAGEALRRSSCFAWRAVPRRSHHGASSGDGSWQKRRQHAQGKGHTHAHIYMYIYVYMCVYVYVYVYIYIYITLYNTFIQSCICNHFAISCIYIWIIWKHEYIHMIHMIWVWDEI